jgi:hypothetical protein
MSMREGLGREAHRPGVTGAAIIDPKDLFRSQLTILRRVLTGIYVIADREARNETDGKTENGREQDVHHPHQVFLIDGARGSGKTSLLLTIQHNLKYLGRPQKWVSRDDAETPPPRLFSDRDNKSKEVLRFQQEHSVLGTRRQTAFYLPVLFPSDLEMDQSIMEGLVARMIRSIDEAKEYRQREEQKEGYDPWKKQQDGFERFEQWKKKAEALVKKANSEVAKGWFLSKNTGIDAILRDSADYKDYLTKRGEANVASFERVKVWRDFVKRFLDFFNSELLLVFFDDTDVAPETTRDILHTMRIFLDNPRIVTVIAANLHAMRQSVLLDGMRELRNPMGALRSEANDTARDWRRFVRRQIEEYLEKVLPRPFRQYIQVDHGPANIRRISAAEQLGIAQRSLDRSGPIALGRQGPKENDRRESDFEKIFDYESFDFFCGAMLNRWRDEFLERKQQAHFRALDDCQEIASDEERTALENYMAWWILRHWYAEALRPRSARHMNALREFTKPKDQETNSDAQPAGAKGAQASGELAIKSGGITPGKRLAVVLFESPDNFELIQRFGDEDKRVAQWLLRQKVQSSWRDQRYIEIDERKIHERTYSYQYLFFRFDLGIAMPVHENVDETPPRGVLPEPSGPNLVGFRRFFPRMRRSRLFGVARDLHHTLIPANCIYMADVDALPDVAWKMTAQEDARDPWGRDINYCWPDFFFFDVDEPLENSEAWGQAQGKEISGFVENALIKDYFVNLVLPMASIGVGQFVHVRDDDGQTLERAVKSSLLRAELEEPVFFQSALDYIDNLRRRLHYSEMLGVSLKDHRSAATLTGKILEDWDKKVLQNVFRPNSSAGQSGQARVDPDFGGLAGHLVDYRWLVNDARCAWHAARIFLNRISDTLRKRSSRQAAEADPAHIFPDTSEITRRDNFFRDDRYTIPTRQAFDRWLRRSKTLKDFLQSVDEKRRYAKNGKPPATIRVEEIGLLGSEGGFFSVDPGWLGRMVEQDIKDIVNYGRGDGATETATEIPLSPENLKLFLTKRTIVRKKPTTEGRPKEDKPKEDRPREAERWPLILDPGLHDQVQLGPEEKEYEVWLAAHESRTHDRLSRALLLFFFGVAPTLPASIHIEVAATLRHSGVNDNSIGKAKEILNDWEHRVRRHLLFVQFYRRALEVTKIRLDLMLIWRRRYKAQGDRLDSPALLGLGEPCASKFGVRATLNPDVCYSSLGIEGIRLFSRRRLFKALPDSGDLWELSEDLRKMQERWDGIKSSRVRILWRSQIETTVHCLVETLNFIVTSRQVLDGWKKPQRAGVAKRSKRR